ncbi:MAG: hypothetical protein DDT24_00926 [Chloroflexi bacterium]|nr:hypothetical protein [Chloroflexota bacterium]
MLSVKNQVFHVLSHSTVETQIMIPGKQALEEPQETYILKQIDLNRTKGPQVSDNGSGLMGNIGNKDRTLTLAGKRVVWGEGVRRGNKKSKIFRIGVAIETTRRVEESR